MDPDPVKCSGSGWVRIRKAGKNSKYSFLTCVNLLRITKLMKVFNLQFKLTPNPFLKSTNIAFYGSSAQKSSVGTLKHH